MAAWTHTSYWSSANYYDDYRKYIRDTARKYRDRTEDCTDLSVFALIDFAASRGLPVTFITDSDFLCSKASCSYSRVTHKPTASRWTNLGQYKYAVGNVISSWNLGNNVITNSIGPQSGDLMWKKGHTALVLQWFAPGSHHPEWVKYGGAVPAFPKDPKDAAKQTDQTIYFRADPGTPGLTWGVPFLGIQFVVRPERPSEPASTRGYIDFLNHRGEENKVKAELILFASVDEMVGPAYGFKFYMYNKGVLDDWRDWSGEQDPPRAPAI